MQVCEYRWSILHAITRILMSFCGWLMIVGLPGLFAWMASINKPHEGTVVLGVAGIMALCWLLHSRKYWRRLFSREPQLRMGPEGLDGPRIGKNPIAWSDIERMVGRERSAEDYTYLTLYTTRGRKHIDLEGLNDSMTAIFRTAETAWQQATAASMPNGGA
ncbi:MAG: hypothetical protein K2X38_24990 [Gemmataceae bacterium]|nr:hypothetical protein [Gemmataceae bacterium]